MIFIQNVIGPSKQKTFVPKVQVPPLLPLLLIDFGVKLFVMLVPNQLCCLSSFNCFLPWIFILLFVFQHKQFEFQSRVDELYLILVCEPGWIFLAPSTKTLNDLSSTKWCIIQGQDLGLNFMFRISVPQSQSNNNNASKCLVFSPQDPSKTITFSKN